MTNLDSILNSRDITLSTKVRLVKAMVFPVVMYGYKSWTRLSDFTSFHFFTEKTIALTRRTFVSKVMSLLFNMLSRLVIAFLPRSKHCLVSWLWSLSAVILEPKPPSKIDLACISSFEIQTRGD